MGSMNPVVVDVSSDEESDPRLDDFEWLTEVLQAVSEKSGSFDEVEVVSEVKGDSKSKHQKSKPLNSTVGDEEDDDDCVVLDGDPEKTTAAAETAVDDDDNAAESDEVLVVGQKGEIACRDFPHPRHSCAKYPFSSTSHEKYCDMCHCYVCDIRAPCPYWCVGVSSIDHCHANDKEDIWRNQREYFRTGKMPSRPVLKPPLARVPSMVTQVHSRNSTSSIIRLSPQTLPRSQVPGIQACSSSTGFPKVRSSRRIGQSRSILQNHGLQHRSVMLLSGVRNSVIQKSRGHYVGHLRSRVASSTSLIPETPQRQTGGETHTPNWGIDSRT
ncbi:PREDICTED: uncharacterized protein LOC104814538 isoform X2 [Tarenaya hassleriana]|uniref:uncharacterized protein LOC104814538 isoform X2 n=1 Tax=Tarenaya hassleriana TaxID=28532 RepID=UPI00053C7A2B|nr:PREDICTED: uncharacterized protein LOC104814538 isoform X2 [Tarenaya hassleriana]